jgi:predicted ABC-type ATPase
MAKNLYVIAGPNGAGKTTFAREFLPHFAHCDEFVNADLIASGLSPFAPQDLSVRAGRLLLDRVKELANSGQDFGFETTLSGQSYKRWFKLWRARGYRIHLFFLWLPTEDLAVARVKFRVQMGGHSIPDRVIRRRFTRGLKNLFTSYMLCVDTAIVYDNSGRAPREIAHLEKGVWQVVESDLYRQLTKGTHDA